MADPNVLTDQQEIPFTIGDFKDALGAAAQPDAPPEVTVDDPTIAEVVYADASHLSGVIRAAGQGKTGAVVVSANALGGGVALPTQTGTLNVVAGPAVSDTIPSARPSRPGRSPRPPDAVADSAEEASREAIRLVPNGHVTAHHVRLTCGCVGGRSPRCKLRPVARVSWLALTLGAKKRELMSTGLCQACLDNLSASPAERRDHDHGPDGKRARRAAQPREAA